MPSSRYSRKRELIKKEFAPQLTRRNFRSKYNNKNGNMTSNMFEVKMKPQLVRQTSYRNIRNATRKLHKQPEMRNIREYGLVRAPVVSETIGNYNIVQKGSPNQYSTFHTATPRSSISSISSIESIKNRPQHYIGYNGEYIPANIQTLKNRMKNLSNNEQNRLLNFYSRKGFPRQ